MQDSGESVIDGNGEQGPIKVGVVNQSSLPDEEVNERLHILKKQVDEDFGPVWNVEAKLSILPNHRLEDDEQYRYREYWGLILLDSDDDIVDLNAPPATGSPRQYGYHDLTKAGLPLAKVFVGTTEEERQDWVHTASHELLEMLANPDLNQVALVHPNATTFRIYAQEVCDPVDPLGYEIDLGEGPVRVSDFVFPAWFTSDGPRPGAQVHWMDGAEIDAPLQLARGGYIGFFDPTTNAWNILVKDAMGHETVRDLPSDDPDALGTLGSRNERRTIPRNRWVTSALDWAP